MSEVARILESADPDDPHAADQLLPIVYEELRRLAAAKMAQEDSVQTLQPTALVHEAWLRLVGEQHSWANRRQFFSAAAEAMRRILIERARRRQRAKHGGEWKRTSLDELNLATETDDGTLLSVHDSLDRLARRDPESAELIKLRFFGGFSPSEAAEFLGLSERSARRTWAYARAWLYDDMRKAS